MASPSVFCMRFACRSQSAVSRMNTVFYLAQSDVRASVIRCGNGTAGVQQWDSSMGRRDQCNTRTPRDFICPVTVSLMESRIVLLVYLAYLFYIHVVAITSPVSFVLVRCVRVSWFLSVSALNVRKLPHMISYLIGVVYLVTCCTLSSPRRLDSPVTRSSGQSFPDCIVRCANGSTSCVEEQSSCWA